MLLICRNLDIAWGVWAAHAWGRLWSGDARDVGHLSKQHGKNNALVRGPEEGNLGNKTERIAERWRLNVGTDGGVQVGPALERGC